MEGWIIAGILGIVLFWAIVIYNRFVSLRAQGDSSWSDIDVQLKRRHNLIPNLVETVKGYATHEKDTLERVVNARQLGIDASTVHEQEPRNVPDRRAAADLRARRGLPGP